MAKSSLFLNVVFLSGFIWIAGCGALDKNAPTKSNFKVAIQSALDKRPRCLTTLVPKDVPAIGKHLRPDTELEPYVAAGLVNRTEANVDARQDWMMLYGPKPGQKVPGYHYDLTELGRKVSHPNTRQHIIAGSHLDFCYAMPEVDEVVRFTQPADAMGMTVTRVTYNYHLANFSEWARNPAFANAENLDRDLSLASQPREESMELILTSDGWRDHP